MAHHRPQMLTMLDVRFGSKADMCSAKGMSALPPKADIAASLGCPLCQNQTEADNRTN